MSFFVQARGLLADEQMARAMEHQAALLLGGLGRNEPHVDPGDGFADGLRVRRIVLQLDKAGWHTPENLPVPDGIRLVYQPARTPELQPAEHLWPLVDEPLANKYFDTIDDLDAVVALRCRDLNFDRTLIAQHTGFHWWPKSAAPN